MSDAALSGNKRYTTRYFLKGIHHLDTAQECQVRLFFSDWLHEGGLDVVRAALDLQRKHARIPGTNMHEAEPCSKGVDDTHVSDQQVSLSVHDLELTCNET
jgi:hypothetical protein